MNNRHLQLSYSYLFIKHPNQAECASFSVIVYRFYMYAGRFYLLTKREPLSFNALCYCRIF